MLFKLKPKVGTHVEENAEGCPKIYKSGDVVESCFNLVKTFPGKFIRVDRDDEKVGSLTVPNIPLPSKGVDLIPSAPLPPAVVNEEEDEDSDADLEA